MSVGHEPVEILLQRYGRSATGRQAARDALVAEAIERARHQAQFMGLSLLCAADSEYGAPTHRCKNDGSTCLCRCHDPQEETP